MFMSTRLLGATKLMAQESHLPGHVSPGTFHFGARSESRAGKECTSTTALFFFLLILHFCFTFLGHVTLPTLAQGPRAMDNQVGLNCSMHEPSLQRTGIYFLLNEGLQENLVFAFFCLCKNMSEDSVISGAVLCSWIPSDLRIPLRGTKAESSLHICVYKWEKNSSLVLWGWNIFPPQETLVI